MSSEVKAFSADLADVTKAFDAGLHDIEKTVDLAALSVQINSALGTLDQFFGGPAGSGIATKTMVTMGLPAADVNASARVLENKGFVDSGTRYWVCNAHTQSAPGRAVSGIGAGFAGPEVASVLLDKYIADPDEATLAGMLVRAHNAAADPTPTSRNNSTGVRVQSGNIDNLRELGKGCGTTANLLEFLKTAYSHGAGFGIVFSTAITQPLFRPASVSRQDFNHAYVRKQFQNILFQDDIMFDGSGDVCYVRTESPVGYSYEPFATVQARHQELAASMNRTPESLPLIRRAVQFPANETVVGRCPVIRSRGCRPEAMTANHFTVGLAVNGIYRIIDVTGDEGSFGIRTSYSTSDIVTNINKVFGDLLLCESSGTEFWLRLRDGFGSSGSLSVFWSGDTDCSHLIGLDNACMDALETGSQGIRTQSAFDLSKALEVTWAGGSVSTTQMTSMGLLLLSQTPKALTATQSASLLSGSDYWTELAANQEFTDLSKTIQSSCVADTKSKNAKTFDARLTDSLAQYESELVFADVTTLGFHDVSILFSGFSVLGLDTILRMKPWIWSIDPFQTESATLSAMQAVIRELTKASGISYSDTEWLTVTSSLPLNYAVAAQLRIQHDRLRYLNDLSESDDNGTDASGFCAYVAAVAGTLQTNSLVTKATTSDQSGTTFIAGFATTSQAQIQAAKVDINQLVWDTLTSDVMDKLAAISIAKAQSILNDGVSIVEDIAGDIASGALSGIRSVVDLIGDLVGGISLSETKRRALAALLNANNALTTAQGFVSRMTSRYAALMTQAESLSNFAINFSGSLGFQSKFVTCVATGSVSALQLDLLAKFLSIINELADKLNKLMRKLRDLLQAAMDKVVCMIDKIMAGLTGTIQYEATVQRGVVTATLSCTMTVPLSIDFDPSILVQINGLRDRILFLVDAMRLQLITFKAHTTNIDATASSFTGSLADTLADLLSKFAKC
jgi:DNA-binding protein YbaB